MVTFAAILPPLLTAAVLLIKVWLARQKASRSAEQQVVAQNNRLEIEREIGKIKTADDLALAARRSGIVRPSK